MRLYNILLHRAGFSCVLEESESEPVVERVPTLIFPEATATFYASFFSTSPKFDFFDSNCSKLRDGV